MRIAKATLMSRWAWSTGLAMAVFAILAALDLRLKALTGVGTADLAAFTSATSFAPPFFVWSAQPYAVRAGFNLGFDYLLMPLYAASFFYSGIIAAEGFAPRPGPAATDHPDGGDGAAGGRAGRRGRKCAADHHAAGRRHGHAGTLGLRRQPTSKIWRCWSGWLLLWRRHRRPGPAAPDQPRRRQFGAENPAACSSP